MKCCDNQHLCLKTSQTRRHSCENKITIIASNYKITSAVKNNKISQDFTWNPKTQTRNFCPRKGTTTWNTRYHDELIIMPYTCTKMRYTKRYQWHLCCCTNDVYTYKPNKITMNDYTFSGPIKTKPTMYLFSIWFLLPNLSKYHNWSNTSKTKTRVYPRHDSKNSDGTPFWMQNDNTRPTNLISSIYTKNSLQNRTFTIPSPTSAGTRRTTSKTHLKIG